MLNTRTDSNSTPKYFFDAITDITPDDVFRMGATAVGFDLDNTSFYDGTLIPVKGLYEWLDKIKAAGIPVIIISNTYKFRAKRISEMLGGIPYICNAEKPDTRCFFEASEKLGISVSELAMVGDQLFTDVQGANNAGAISVKVRYMAREIVFGIKFLIIRRKEKLYLRSKGLGDKI